MVGLEKSMVKYEGEIKKFFKKLKDPNFFNDFDEALERELNGKKKFIPPGLYYQGLYAYHISTYLSYFNSRQFFYIESEAFKRTPQLILAKLTSFLGLRPFEWNSIVYEPINVGSSKRPLKSKFQHIYKTSNQELFKLIGQEYNW